VRDLIFALLLLVMFGLALRSAFAAIMFWAWAGLMALDHYTYGFLQGVALGTGFAAIALLRITIQMARGEDRGTVLQADYRYAGGATVVLLVLMLLHCWAVGALAYPGLARNAEYVENISKTVLLCLLLPMVLRTTAHLHAMLWLIALTLGVHASIEALRFIITGGAHIVRGVTKFGDNNHLAVLTTMMIPLALHLRRHLTSVLLRWAGTAISLTLVVAVVATNSRGGLISLLALALGLLALSKKKIRGFIALCVAGVLLVALAPEQWGDRMQTIDNANEDSSFLGRLAAWQVSSAIAIQNPVFGGGFHAVEKRDVWVAFQEKPGLLGWTGVQVFDGNVVGAKAAHSIYFEVLGDQGFAGFFLYFGFIGVGILSAWRLWRHGRRINEDHWACGLGKALGLSLFIFCVGGGGVSIAYSEIPFYLVTLSMIALYMARSQSKAEMPPLVPAK
jgi:probable O-glycosylation ligase (exosortase A-associated)